MANMGMVYSRLPPVTQQCVMTSLSAKLPLLKPRRLAVCLIGVARLGVVHSDLSKEIQLKISECLVQHKEELMNQEIR